MRVALILQNSAMVHIPKTGGTWIHGALFQQGLVRGILHSPENYPHPSSAQTRIFGLPMFCFVRHPVDWLRSFWASGTRNKWQGVERIRFDKSPWSAFSACESERFEDFVAKYLETCPGEVGRLFDRYTAGCKFVGRYETLLPDLEKAFRMFREPVDMDKLRAVPPLNVGQKIPIDPVLARAVRKAERAIMERFYKG